VISVVITFKSKMNLFRCFISFLILPLLIVIDIFQFDKKSLFKDVINIYLFPIFCLLVQTLALMFELPLLISFDQSH